MFIIACCKFRRTCIRASASIEKNQRSCWILRLSLWWWLIARECWIHLITWWMFHNMRSRRRCRISHVVILIWSMFLSRVSRLLWGLQVLDNCRLERFVRWNGLWSCCSIWVSWKRRTTSSSVRRLCAIQGCGVCFSSCKLIS